VSFPIERIEAWARFDAFYLEEHERLFKALYFVTGNRQDAEELMQDAFLKLWERWDKIQRISDPAAYLFRVALNGFRMRRRRAAAHPRAHAAAASRPPAPGPARVPVRAGGAHPARAPIHGEGPGNARPTGPTCEGRSAGCLRCRRCSTWLPRRSGPIPALSTDSTGSSGAARSDGRRASMPSSLRSAWRRSE